MKQVRIWSGKEDSNLRPLPPEDGAPAGTAQASVGAQRIATAHNGICSPTVPAEGSDGGSDPCPFDRIEGSGYLYFVRDEASNAIKIGRATDPRKRFHVLCSCNPNKLELLDAIPDIGWQEAFWHAAFGYLHIRGEWFTENRTIVAAMRAARTTGDWLRHVPPLIVRSDGIPVDEAVWFEHIVDAFSHFGDLKSAGYMTPKQAAEYAIFDPDFDGRTVADQMAAAA